MITVPALAGLLKRLLLLFWTAWFTIVLATNVTDALKEIGILPDG